MAYEIGQSVMFAGKEFTLLEKRFDSPHPMWLGVESNNASAKPRLLIESDIRPVQQPRPPITRTLRSPTP